MNLRWNEAIFSSQRNNTVPGLKYKSSINIIISSNSIVLLTNVLKPRSLWKCFRYTNAMYVYLLNYVCVDTAGIWLELDLRWVNDIQERNLLYYVCDLIIHEILIKMTYFRCWSSMIIQKLETIPTESTRFYKIHPHRNKLWSAMKQNHFIQNDTACKPLVRLEFYLI